MNKRNPQATATLYRQTVESARARGGSALHTMFLHEATRYLNRMQPANPLEAKVFAAFGRNPSAIADYMQRWANLPAADTKAMLGEHPKTLRSLVGTGPSAAVTREAACQLVKFAQVTMTLPAARTVDSVRIRRVKCVDETNPEKLWFINLHDEVCASYLVTAGETRYSKETSVYTGFDDGTERAFSDADATVWPGGDALHSHTPVNIVATLYEDDTGDIVKAKEVISIAIDVLIAILTFLGVKSLADIVAKVKEYLPSVLVVFPAVQIIGTDGFAALPTGEVVGADGAPKSSLSFRGLGGEYRLDGIEVAISVAVPA